MTKWYQNKPGKGEIRFSDGVVMKMPPRTKFDQDEILRRVAEIKAPVCKSCGASPKIPRIIEGKIKFHCPTCERLRYLRRRYKGLTPEELKSERQKLKEATRILKEFV